MSLSENHRAIEAVLMVAEQPVEPGLLAQLLEVAPTRVDELCAELAAQYEADERGFILVKVAGGYRFQSHPDLAAYVERFVLEGQTSRLSAAALETLAIVAYKQPVSRAQVAAIRGVNVDGVLRTLQQRGYVEEVARDPGPGQALLYGTTPLFLERLGLASVDDLPALGEFVPGAEIMEALEYGLRGDDGPAPRAPAAPAGATAGEQSPAPDRGEASESAGAAGDGGGDGGDGATGVGEGGTTATGVGDRGAGAGPAGDEAAEHGAAGP